MVLCCLCGTPIEPNAVTMCVECIRQQTDITETIQRTCDIVQCGSCDRYNVTREKWVRHELETTGMMSFCLKKIAGLQGHDTKILDARWIWTEPHSKRLKIAVHVQKTVLEKVTINQNVIIEYTMKSRQCKECIHDQTAHNWGAVIQLRQRNVKSRRTMASLEAMLAKMPNVASRLKRIVIQAEGMDLYCPSKGFADKLSAFISSHFPAKSKHSSHLVSADVHGGGDRYEHTIQMDLASLTRGDLVVTSRELTGSVELMLVRNVSSSLHLISPTTTAMADVTHTRYFARPMEALFAEADLIPYVVLDVEVVGGGAGGAGAGAGAGAAGGPGGSMASGGNGSTNKVKHRYRDASTTGAADDTSVTPSQGASTAPSAATTAHAAAHHLYAQLAEAWVVRESDLGSTNDMEEATLHCFTHLGHLLRPGDVVMGYDLKHSTLVNFASSLQNSGATSKSVSNLATPNNAHLLHKLTYDVPDVVLVQRLTSKQANALRTQRENEAAVGGRTNAKPKGRGAGSGGRAGRRRKGSRQAKARGGGGGGGGGRGGSNAQADDDDDDTTTAGDVNMRAAAGAGAAAEVGDEDEEEEDEDEDEFEDEDAVQIDAAEVEKFFGEEEAENENEAQSDEAEEEDAGDETPAGGVGGGQSQTATAGNGSDATTSASGSNTNANANTTSAAAELTTVFRGVGIAPTK